MLRDGGGEKKVPPYLKGNLKEKSLLLRERGEKILLKREK